MVQPGQLTSEQFREWKSQDTTEQVFKFLEDYRKSWEEKSPLRESMEQTFKEAAMREGVLLGLDALLEMTVDD